MQADDRPLAVIFDLGGVLVELGPLSALLGPDAPPEEDFWPEWLHSKVVRDFEGGRCSIEEFGRRAVAEFGLEFRPDEFIEKFRLWPQGLYRGAAELLDELAAGNDGLVIGALSNSNPIHWYEQRDAATVRALFNAPFLSYELQLIKPDREIFDHVQTSLDLAPAQILYFDDNQINVDAARAAGWRSEVTKGPLDCRQHLVAAGLL